MPIIEITAQAGKDGARGRNGVFVPRSISVYVSVRAETVQIQVDSRRPGGNSPITLELSAGNALNFSIALKAAVNDLFRIINTKQGRTLPSGE